MSIFQNLHRLWLFTKFTFQLDQDSSVTIDAESHIRLRQNPTRKFIEMLAFNLHVFHDHNQTRPDQIVFVAAAVGSGVNSTNCSEEIQNQR